MSYKTQRYKQRELNMFVKQVTEKYSIFQQHMPQHRRAKKFRKVKKCDSFQVEKKQLKTHLKHKVCLLVYLLIVDVS